MTDVAAEVILVIASVLPPAAFSGDTSPWRAESAQEIVIADEKDVLLNFPFMFDWRGGLVTADGNVMVAAGDGPIIAGVIAKNIDRESLEAHLDELVARDDASFEYREEDQDEDMIFALQSVHDGYVMDTYISFPEEGFDMLATMAASGERAH
ncbi:MAG: hypothetical protein AAFY66_07920 [Pseudomonadota bacterium]